MSANILNQSPFIRTSRLFPEEIEPLVVEINRSYTDIATNINDRTIGLFPTNRPAIGGESWFVSKNQKQQNLRQVYNFTDANLTQVHGINISSLSNFVRIWGTFFDGTNWQALPYLDVVNVTNQISVKVSPTQIIVTKGATAPAISKGLIILEWISQA